MRCHFHCTDGQEMILDRRGRPLRADGDTRRQAEAVARRLMADHLIAADWRRWIVCVYNEFGEQIDLVPFPAQTSQHKTALSPQREPLRTYPQVIAHGGLNDNSAR